MAERRTSVNSAPDREATGFVERHGQQLPNSYGDVAVEYGAGHETAALHDFSYNGRIKATGEDVLDLIHRISTNDVGSLVTGQGAPTILTTDRGRVLDLITLHNLGGHILIITGPGTQERVIEWIDKYTIVEDAVLEDVTSSTAMLSVMGPQAKSVLESLGAMDVQFLEPYGSVSVTIGGVEAMVIRRDLVSLLRFEVVVQGEDRAHVWRQVAAAGATPIGLEAYEILRVEQGSPGYDGELGDTHNPLEAGLWGSISFTKGCYIGQEVIARLDTYKKVQRHLVSLTFSPGFRGQEGGMLTQDGREVGQVTSVAMVPTTSQVIGLGYVRKEASEPRTVMGIAHAEGEWARVETRVLPYGPGQ